MTAREFFENKLPEKMTPEVTKDLSGSIQFRISGENGGDWYVNPTDGGAELAEGLLDDPSCTIGASDENWMKLLKGELNATAAVMTGKIKISGDMFLAMKLQSFL